MDDLAKVQILEDGGGGVRIRNLSTVPIATEEDGINQLFIGSFQPRNSPFEITL